jgi:hypothetical protein
MCLAVVEGVRRTPAGGWVVDVLNSSGRRELPAGRLHTVAKLTLPAARSLAASRGLRAIRLSGIETTLADWKGASLAEWATPLVPGAELSRGHQAFEFTVDRRRIVVPALLLIDELLGPTGQTAPYLLMPHGLEALCVPANGDACVSICFATDVDNHLQNSRGRTCKFLSWVWSFPSARDAWNSVYEFANNDACLGLRLPKVQLSVVIQGVEVDNVLLATHLVVQRLKALEEPFEFAATHPGWFDGDKRGRLRREVPRLGHGIGARVPLTDCEWTAIRPHLQPRERPNAPRHAELRGIVDAVLHKLSTGSPWRQLTVPGCSWMNAQQHYRQWLRSGAWGEAMQQLRFTPEPRR